MKWQSEQGENSIGQEEIDFFLFYEDHSFPLPYNSVAQ